MLQVNVPLISSVTTAVAAAFGRAARADTGMGADGMGDDAMGFVGEGR